MPQQNIILTGFMGTGKSSVGRLLAMRLQRPFVDTDHLIVERHGSIPIIFAEQGEAAFRQMEREIAQELAVQSGLIISTGGRLMLDAVNAQVLAENGRIFCLTASPEQILRRLSRAGVEKRPLLATPNPAQTIADLLADRAAGYGQFEQVDTNGRTVREVVFEIVRRLDGKTAVSP